MCKVTFSVDAKEATSAAVIGDFNNWNVAQGEMVKLKTGTFKGLFEIPSDQSYEFKYLVDGAFINEPEADAQVWNDYAGAENSVLAV